MEIWILLVRTVLIYAIVFIVMRFMGKREIGKLSVLDLVISFMIAEIAVIVIEDTETSMWKGIVPMLVLMVIQIVTAVISMKNRKLRLFFDGKPSVIIANGKLNADVMRKQRYSLDDLMLQLRENQISSITDVEFAILETSGKLSVIKKDDDDGELVESGLHQSEATSMNQAIEDQIKQEKVIPPKYRYEVLPIPLIMDGKVQDENLTKLEKTRFWLKNVLQEHKVYDFKEVFFCTIDHKGKLFIDVYDHKVRG